MIRMAKRLQALERVFRVEPAEEKASVIFQRALSRLGDRDLAVLEEVATLRDQGKLSQLTAAQEEMLGRRQGVVDGEARNAGYACFKESEDHS